MESLLRSLPEVPEHYWTLRYETVREKRLWGLLDETDRTKLLALKKLIELKTPTPEQMKTYGELSLELHERGLGIEHIPMELFEDKQKQQTLMGINNPPW